MSYVTVTIYARGAERELAREYGIAIGTARRAVKELVERGLVRVLPGRGTFVKRQ